MTITDTRSQVLQTVPNVDLKNIPENGLKSHHIHSDFKRLSLHYCEYILSDKDYVVVENRCNKDSVTGKQAYIKGKAFVEKSLAMQN